MLNHDLPGRLFLVLLGISGLLMGVILVLGTAGAANPAMLGLSVGTGEIPDTLLSSATATIPVSEQPGQQLPASEPSGEIASAKGMSTQEILENTVVSAHDKYLLAEKYLGTSDVPFMLKTEAVIYQNGASRNFWVLNVNTNAYRQITAALAYQTPHLLFWVENGVDYEPEDVMRLADAFENQIYARNRALFGSEFSPGVDNDLRLTILYADQLGGAAGYFSSADSYMPEIDRYSNQSEMFYLSADHIHLSQGYAYGVMAHEFQHMIHWFQDRDEEAWINEGLSELAVDLNGFDTGGFTYLFASNPDLQLNFWPGNDQGSSAPHYGASYLFIKYLYEQFGKELIRDLVSQPENGFSGVRAALLKHGFINADDANAIETLFQDWTVTNFLHGKPGAASEGGYQDTDLALRIEPGRTISCGDAPIKDTVSQFGTDYIAIDCSGDFEVMVNWDDTVRVLPADPHSGTRYYWSNRGDESAMRLTRDFDLTSVDTPVKLAYWTWYDIERDYDYLYLNVSINGVDWETLAPPSCSMENSTGANYSCGYNGRSGNWIREEVDLSPYAGMQITLQFEYITDAAVNGEGFLIDDISIEAIDYVEDFEGSAPGWIAEGFVQIENELPQRMGIILLQEGGDGMSFRNIQQMPSDAAFSISAGEPGGLNVLALSGLTQHTRMLAGYQLSVQALP
jgi:hypothetical protein